MTDVAGGLITLEYALAGLQYSGTIATRDDDVKAYIIAATPIIERIHGPVLQTTKTIRANGGKSAVLLTGRIANAAAVTAVRVDGAAWTGHVVDPDDGIVYAGAGRAFTAGVANVEIDVTVGYAIVPQNLQLAARELVRWWIQDGKQSPSAGALSLPAAGGPGVDDSYAIPRRVYQLCAPGAGSGFA